MNKNGSTYDGNGSEWNLLLLLIRAGASGSGRAHFRRPDHGREDLVRRGRTGNHFRDDGGTSARSVILKEIFFGQSKPIEFASPVTVTATATVAQSIKHLGLKSFKVGATELI